MPFNAGSVIATIRADGLDGFKRETDRAKGALEGVKSAGDRVEQGLKKSFHAAATAATTATAAVAGIATKVFSTGAAYNTLQQTSRAALTTLLGSAEAANAQMDKLDQFASTSPFAKGMFITAQQQMLAFGIESKKVIPYLDSIQNAVAATGGSSDQVGELAFIMAQISSASKITGEDLMQFGQRGVNAADLIGSQMGKSGAEIRESITKGTLDADEALDALTTAMGQKVEGASANVKQTVSGMQDRIKASMRDIGATMAEPFIGQKGGGLWIQWGNQAADVLQAVKGHMQPLVGIVTTRLAPGFATITRALDSAKVSVKAWDSSRFESFLTAADNHKAAIAGVAGGLAAFSSGLLSSIPLLGQFIPAVSPLTGILGGIALASPEVREALGEVFQALEPLIPAAVDFAGVVSESLNQALPIAADLISAFASAITPVVKLVASIPAPVLAGAAAALILGRNMGGLRTILTNVLGSFRRFGEEAAVQRKLAEMSGTATRMGGAFDVVAKKASGLKLALKNAFISNPIGLAIMGVTTVVGFLTAAFTANAEKAKNTKERMAELRDTFTETGAAGAETGAKIEENLSKIFDDVSSKSTKKFVDELGGLDAALLDYGTTSQDVAKMVQDGGAEYEAFIGLLKEAAAETETVNRHTGRGMSHRVEQATAEAKVARDLLGVYEQGRSEYVETASLVEKLAEKQRENYAAMSDSERSLGRMNDALGILADTTRDANERLNAFHQFLDELNGGAKSEEDRVLALAQATASLSDAYHAVDEDGNLLIDSIVKSSGEIDKNTEAGRALYTQMQDLSKQQEDAALKAADRAIAEGRVGDAIKDAEAASKEYTDTAKNLGDEVELAGDKSKKLIDRYFSDPHQMVLALAQGGMDELTEAEKKVFELAADLAADHDMKVTVKDEDLPALMDLLAGIEVDISDMPNLKVETDDGSIVNAEAEIAQLTRRRELIVEVKQALVNWFDYGDGDANANGGFYNGMVKAYANGGFPTGIYAGRTGGIHKFAEPETGWEAYVSGKAGQEDRNRGILKEAAKRLGGMAVFANGGIAGNAFANGAITKSAHDSILDWLRDWNTAQRRGENRDAGLNGNGLSLVDKLLDIGHTIGGNAGKALLQTARNSEAAYLRLAKAADTADAKLERTQEKNEKRIDQAEAKLEATRDKNDAKIDAAQAKLEATRKKNETRLAAENLLLGKRNEKLKDTNDKLSIVTRAFDGLKSAAASMASSVSGAVRRIFNLGKLGEDTVTETTRTERTTQTVGGFELTTSQQVTDTTTRKATAGSIAAGLSATAAKIKKFADKLKKLKDRGLSPALLAELANLGIEGGEQVADALLTATAAEMAAINKSYAAIDANSALAGKTVSDANYADQIAAQQRQVDLAQRQVDAAQKQVEAAQRQIEAIKAQTKSAETATAKQIDRINAQTRSAETSAEKQIKKIESETAKAVAAAEKQQKSLQSKLASETNRIIGAITGALKDGKAAPVKKYAGGPIIGPGTGTSDDISMLASNGEHMWTALETSRAGGHAAVARLRNLAVRGGLDLSRAGEPVAVPVPVGGGGDEHYHFELLPQAGEPLSTQVVRAASTVQLHRRARKRGR